MADITKAAAPYLVDNAPDAMLLGPLYAGEVIPVGSPCYIATTGLVMKTITTTHEDIVTLSKFDGFCIDGAPVIGDPVTLMGVGSRIHITETTGIVIGNFYWASATAASIADTIVLAGDTPLAKGVSATDIRVIRTV